MKPFSFRERQQMLEELESQSFDIAVLGGGITGVGIAREAVYRGLKVALFEQKDFAAATSSHSSKLIHGGLRYLEQYEFALVAEALRERHRLLHLLAPHLVHPLPFLLPVWRSSPFRPWEVRLGLSLYDLLAQYRSPRLHRPIPKSQLPSFEPALQHESVEAAFLYYDAQTDDSRLTLETAISAYERGAYLLTYTRGCELLTNKKGRVSGLTVEDVLTGKTYEVKATCVVNATGPFSNAWIHKLRPSEPPFLRPTKGIHLIFSRDCLPLRHAVTFTSAVDRRVMFAIPWGDFALVGTSDTEEVPQLEGGVDRKDVEYILASTEGVFSRPLQFEDVVSAYAGWRPLVWSEGSESDISRKHELHFLEEGLLSVGGGKLTTYRQMAEEAVCFLARHYSWPISPIPLTRRIPLPGAIGLTRQDSFTTPYGVRKVWVDTVCAGEKGWEERLIEYLPYRRGEVAYQVHYEMAMTVEDVLLRRTQIGWKTSDLGKTVAEEVLDLLAQEHQWDEERKRQEWRRYLEFREKHESWRR